MKFLSPFDRRHERQYDHERVLAVRSSDAAYLKPISERRSYYPKFCIGLLRYRPSALCYGTNMNSVIIVLGSPNDEEGALSQIAKSRCERAFFEFRKHPNFRILCTGGFGEHFNKTNRPHAEYAQDYLKSKGVPSSKFIDIAESSFTLEDATLSKPIIEKYGIENAILVTSDFHMERAVLVFSCICPSLKLTCSAAQTGLLDYEIEMLKEHESKAIERERQNLKSLTMA